MSALAALLGAALAGGIALLALGLTPRTPAPGALRRRPRRRPDVHLGKLGALIVGVGVLTLVMTVIGRRPVFLVLVPLLAWLVVTMLRPDKEVSAVAKAQGLESWTRRLAGLLLSGGTSLEGAIRASLDSTPATIKPQVTTLVADLNSRMRIEPALHRWAEAMNDESADMVAATLIMSSRTRTGGSTQALTALAGAIAERTRMLQTVDAERSGTRAGVIFQVAVIILFTIATLMVPFLTTFYTTAGGQFLHLIAVIALVGLLIWYRSLAGGIRRERFLVDSPVGGR